MSGPARVTGCARGKPDWRDLPEAWSAEILLHWLAAAPLGSRVIYYRAPRGGPGLAEAKARDSRLADRAGLLRDQGGSWLVLTQSREGGETLYRAEITS